MLVKSNVQNTLKMLPEKFTIDELIEQLIFIEKVEEGIEQSKQRKVISNKDVKEIINKWSK